MPQTFLIQTPDPNDPTRTLSTPVEVDEDTLNRIRAEDPDLLASLHTPQEGQLEALRTEQDIQRRQEVVRQMPIFGRLAGFGVGISNELSIGLVSRFMDPEERRTLEATTRELPYAVLAGQGVGALAPALITGGASTLEEAGAAALLPSGLSQLAGNATERLILARLAGANPLLARGLSMAAGAGVDGAISGAQAAVTQANIEGTPLDAESVLASVGLGAGLGLITGGLLGGTQGAGEALLRRTAGREVNALAESGQGSFARFTEDGGIEMRPPDAPGRQAMTDLLDHPLSRFVTGNSQADNDLLNRLMNPENMRRSRAEGDYTNFTRDSSNNTAAALNEARVEAVQPMRSAAARQAGFEALDGVADLQPLQGAVRGWADGIRRSLREAGQRAPQAASVAGEVADLLDHAAIAPTAGELARRLDNTIDRVRTERLAGSIQDADIGSAVAAAIGDGTQGSVSGLESLLERMGPEGARAVAAHRALRDFDLAVRDGRAAGLRHNVSLDELRLDPGRLFASVSDSGFRVKNDFTPEFVRVNSTAAQAVDTAARHFGMDPAMAVRLRDKLLQSSSDLVLAREWGSDIAAGRILAGREGKNAGLFAAAGLGGVGLSTMVGGMVGGPVGAGLGFLAGTAFTAFTHPYSTLTRLSELSAARNGTVTRLTEEVGRLRATLERGRAASKQAVRQVPRLVVGLRSPEQRKQEYKRITGELQRLAGSPVALMDRLGDVVGPVTEVSPELASYMSQTYVRGVQYLVSNLPPADQPSVFGHLMDLEPSQAEMDAFVRRFEAVEDPLAIVGMASSYSLTTDHVQAVRSVYPELFSAIQAEITGMIADLDHLPPYSARIQVSTLLDVPADPSYDSVFISRMQQRYAQTQSQQQQIGPRQTAAGTRRIATDTYSESTSLDVRLNRGN